MIVPVSFEQCVLVRYPLAFSNGIRAFACVAFCRLDLPDKLSRVMLTTRALKAIAKFRELNPGRAGPLIITLENYCSLVQQQQMALILKKAFKQDLLIDEDTAIATNRRWPSICEIQGKVCRIFMGLSPKLLNQQ